MADRKPEAGREYLDYATYLGLETLLGRAAAAERPAPPRRAAVHRPAPDDRALVQAHAPRAARGDRARPSGRPRGLVQDPGPGQAHPAAAPEPVERPRDAHPDRIRPVPLRPRAGERLPVAPESADRDRSRQARPPASSMSFATRRRSARSSRRRFARPSLYDEFLRWLARRGFAVPRRGARAGRLEAVRRRTPA